MTVVWELDLPDSEKLALLALADNANDQGVCWPSMATLSRKCSKSDRTVQRSIQSLEEKGHLTREERPGKGVLYHIHPRHDVTPDKVTPPSPCRPTPDTVSDKPSRTTNSPQPPQAGSGERDPGDEHWRIPHGRSWKETRAVLRQLNGKPKRQPRRERHAPRTAQPEVRPAERKPVLAQQREDERSQELRSFLKRTLGEQNFDHWFATAALLVDQAGVTVIAASQFQSNWMEQNFRGEIFSAARRFYDDAPQKITFQTGQCTLADAIG